MLIDRLLIVCLVSQLFVTAISYAIYDNNHRLTTTNYADGNSETQSYDAVGNRIQSTINDTNGTRTIFYKI